jgi:hypothetical protein
MVERIRLNNYESEWSISDAEACLAPLQLFSEVLSSSGLLSILRPDGSPFLIARSSQVEASPSSLCAPLAGSRYSDVVSSQSTSPKLNQC